MTNRLLTADEFRSSARDGARPTAGVFRLATSDPAAVEGAARTLRFTFSDGSVDRAGDTVNPNGWDLGDFLKNSVALWCHQSDQPPIGRALNVGVTGGKLKGDIEFITADISPFADTIFRMTQAGFLKSVSVGFMPLEWERSKDKSRPYGIDFKRQSLLEISLCPVPMLPSALIDAKAAGIDVAPIREWAEKVLDGGASVMVPRAELERLRLAAKPLAGTARRKSKKAAPKLTTRGLYEVSWLASLLESLGYLEDMVEWEAEQEGDGSAVPAMLADALRRLGAALVAMTTEEVTELLGEELPETDGGSLVTAALRGHLAIAKAGRVLSASNEADIKAAVELLTNVLAQVDASDEAKAATQRLVERHLAGAGLVAIKRERLTSLENIAEANRRRVQREARRRKLALIRFGGV